MKFSIKNFFSKCDQIRRKLKESLMKNFIFCAVLAPPKTSKLLSNSHLQLCLSAIISKCNLFNGCSKF